MEGVVFSKPLATKLRDLVRTTHYGPDAKGPGEWQADHAYRWVSVSGVDANGNTVGTAMIQSKQSGYVSFGSVCVDTDLKEGLLWCECIGYDDADVPNLWFSPVDSGKACFAQLTAKGSSCSADAYAWSHATPAACGEWEIGSPDGELGTQITVTLTTPGDGSTHAVWSVDFSTTPTGGTYSFLLDSVPQGPFAFNASPSGLTSATVSGSFPTFTVTSTIFGGRTLSTGDISTLEPLPQSEAFELNGNGPLASELPKFVVMYDGAGSTAKVTTRTSQKPDVGTSTPQKFILTASNVVAGKFTVAFDGSPSSDIAFNANASAVATAIGHGVSVTGSSGGPWTITCADHLPHTLDTPDLTHVYDDKDYRFEWGGSGGSTCLKVISDVSCSDGEWIITYKWISVNAAYDTEDDCTNGN